LLSDGLGAPLRALVQDDEVREFHQAAVIRVLRDLDPRQDADAPRAGLRQHGGRSWQGALRPVMEEGETRDQIPAEVFEAATRFEELTMVLAANGLTRDEQHKILRDVLLFTPAESVGDAVEIVNRDLALTQYFEQYGPGGGPFPRIMRGLAEQNFNDLRKLLDRYEPFRDSEEGQRIVDSMRVRYGLLADEQASEVQASLRESVAKR